LLQLNSVFVLCLQHRRPVDHQSPSSRSGTVICNSKMRLETESNHRISEALPGHFVVSLHAVSLKVSWVGFSKCQVTSRLRPIIPEIGAWLQKVGLAYYQYHAIPEYDSAVHLQTSRVQARAECFSPQQSARKDALGKSYPSLEPVDCSIVCCAPYPDSRFHATHFS